MATTTTYYGLTKPLGTENVNVGIINANSDIIDTEMNRNRLQAALNLAEIYDSGTSYSEGDYCTYLTASGYKLYKCLDTTTGAFDSTKWEETDVSSNFGSGGGGGGGNANVEHLTQAEYDALPDSKYSDDKLYLIEDVTSKEVEGEVYSLDEQIVGRWIDGSVLYRKTIDFGALPNATTKEVPHGISNIDEVINIYGVANDGSTYFVLPILSTSNVTRNVLLYATTTNIGIQNSYNYSDFSAKIVIEYTKS